MKNNMEKLQEVRASGSLHDRIGLMAQELPDLHSHSAVALFTFRLALAGLVLVVLGSVGSGVLLSAKGSNQGSLLYPIKLEIDAHHVPFFSSPPTPPVSLPIVVPSKAVEPSATPSGQQEKQGENQDQPFHASVSGTVLLRHSISGEGGDDGGDQENVKGAHTFSLPEFFRHIPQVFHFDRNERHKDD